MQIIDGLTKLYDGTIEVLEGVNPMVTTMSNETNQLIANTLLDKGFTKEQIMDFISVSKTQLEEWLELEVKVRERIAMNAKRKRKAPSTAAEA